MFLRRFACTFMLRGQNIPRRQIVSYRSFIKSFVNSTLLTLEGLSPSGKYSLNLQDLRPNLTPFRTRPVNLQTLSLSLTIFLVLIPSSICFYFSSISSLIFLREFNSLLRYFYSSRALASSWAALFFLFLCLTSITGSSEAGFTLRGIGTDCSKSMILSLSLSISSSRGLYEYPDSGAITEGTSAGLYLCFPQKDADHGSSTCLSLKSLTILLSYLGLGRGCALFLKRLGSSGGRTLSLSSTTSSWGLNLSLIYASCSCLLAQISSETSIFLAHFFLFCFPLSPLILTKSAISTLIYKQIIHRPTTVLYLFLWEMKR